MEQVWRDEEMKSWRDDQVEVAIRADVMRWRNEEMSMLEADIECVAQAMATLSTLVHDQGETLALAETEIETTVVNVQEATGSLERASTWQDRWRSIAVDTTLLIVGAGLGCVGFLGGPVVGALALTAGLTTSVAIVGARKVIKAK